MASIFECSMFYVFAITSLFSVDVVCGSAFLEKSAHSAQFLNQSVIEERFLEEVRGLVGKGPMDGQLPRIRKALEPMWLALPKNSQGRLGNAQVRYALHRYFAKRHGWHLDGLDRSESESSPTSILNAQQVPTFVMDLFEEAFGQSGLMLHELSLFAATLERIIHDEASNRLSGVYEALAKTSESFGQLVVGTSSSTRLSVSDVDEAVKVYMMTILLGQEKLQPETGTLQKHQARLAKDYPAWSDTLMWLQDVRETVAYQNQPSTNPFVAEQGIGLDTVESIVEQVSDRLGSFQNTECSRLKDLLMETEHKDSGRVLLSDFYRKGMETTMQFVEKPEYLRQLGALDESQPGEPRVVIPNYILSKGNCLADMGFYSICCINECDALMADLEQTIAAPQALPERIVAVLGNMSTSTVEASGNLDEKMLRRLGEVAARNGGKVPLHGRLFAQWLHFLFPRECPYPNLPGTTSPLTADEWVETYAEKPNLKRKEMRAYIDSVASGATGVTSSDHGEEEDSLTHWSEQEEILYLPARVPSEWPSFLAKYILGGAFVLTVAVAVVDCGKRSGSLETVLGKEKSHLV